MTDTTTQERLVVVTNGDQDAIKLSCTDAPQVLRCTFHDLIVEERDGCKWFDGSPRPDPGADEGQIVVGTCDRCSQSRWEVAPDRLDEQRAAVACQLCADTHATGPPERLRACPSCGPDPSLVPPWAKP